jgi:hypothetical protein
MQWSYATNCLFGARQPQQEPEKWEIGKKKSINHFKCLSTIVFVLEPVDWGRREGRESSSGAHARLAGFVLTLPRTYCTVHPVQYFALRPPAQSTTDSPLPSPSETDRSWPSRASDAPLAATLHPGPGRRHKSAGSGPRAVRKKNGLHDRTAVAPWPLLDVWAWVRPSVRSTGSTAIPARPNPEQRRAVASHVQNSTARPRHRHCHRVLVVASRPYWGGTTGGRDQDRGSTCPIMPGDGDRLARFGKHEQATECLNRAECVATSAGQAS